MRAVIDIGSNSVLLLVGRRGPDGSLTIVRDEARVARLSEGVAARGSLSPEAIARTLAVLQDYRALADEHGAPLEAVATEGLRMASNQEDFLRPAAAILGREVRMISGEEEARLSYRSVALEHDPGAPLRVVDIGGASTELVAGRGLEVAGAVSHRLGSVRWSERFGGGHPPSAATLEAMQEAAREVLRAQPMTAHEELHGLAGTVTTTGALALGLERYERGRVDGTRLSTAAVRELRDQLATWPLERLQAQGVLGKGRADVVVAGMTILLMVLEHCGANTLVIRDRGLRYALL